MFTLAVFFINIFDLYFGSLFLDPPGKTSAPVVQDVDEDSVVLSWDKPKDDGGDKIKGYVVEVREGGTGKWKPLNEKAPCKDTKYTGS